MVAKPWHGIKHACKNTRPIKSLRYLRPMAVACPVAVRARFPVGDAIEDMVTPKTNLHRKIFHSGTPIRFMTVYDALSRSQAAAEGTSGINTEITQSIITSQRSRSFYMDFLPSVVRWHNPAVSFGA